MSQPITVTTGPDQACHRCGSNLLLSAVNAFGRTITVCESCDVNDQWAGPIVRYFQLHGQLQPDSLEAFADLVNTWVRKAMPPEFDHQRWEAEYEAWRRGEF